MKLVEIAYLDYKVSTLKKIKVFANILSANISEFSDSLGKSGDLEADGSMPGAEEHLPC